MLGQAALSDLLETSELNIGTRIRRPKLKGGGLLIRIWSMTGAAIAPTTPLDPSICTSPKHAEPHADRSTDSLPLH